MPDSTMDLARHALSTARRFGFAEVEITFPEGAFSAKLQRQKVSTPAPADTPKEQQDVLLPIKSTLVGFYREAPEPLAVGKTIAAGDVVAVIAALGLANDIESKVSGEVVEVLIQAGEPVEYGQVLARVQP